VGRLEQVRWHAGDNRGFARIPGTVFSQVASHLGSSHREADQAEITQLEVGNQLVKILCECVVVVADGRLAGLPEASTVISDDPVTCSEKYGRLPLPRRAAQWVSVNQNDRLSRAVVFVVKLDAA